MKRAFANAAKLVLGLTAILWPTVSQAAPLAIGVGLGSFGGGLSLQTPVGPDSFVQGTVGARAGGDFLLNLDYAYTAPFNQELLGYVGPGLAVHGGAIGPRIPIGILFHPASLPMQLGAEVAPTVLFGKRDDWGFVDLALYARIVVK